MDPHEELLDPYGELVVAARKVVEPPQEVVEPRERPRSTGKSGGATRRTWSSRGLKNMELSKAPSRAKNRELRKCGSITRNLE